MEREEGQIEKESEGRNKEGNKATETSRWRGRTKETIKKKKKENIVK
jgi:hypothetical protein